LTRRLVHHFRHQHYAEYPAPCVLSRPGGRPWL